jgi:hypothetical protein
MTCFLARRTNGSASMSVTANASWSKPLSRVTTCVGRSRQLGWAGSSLVGRVGGAADSTCWDGAGYRSTQCITLPDSAQAFDAWGTRRGLAAMLRTYFAVAEGTVGRLVRPRWQGRQPSLVLLWPPIPFITMGEPAFDISIHRRAISVPIKGGLLVMPSAQAHLRIELTRRPFDILARVELVGYLPRFGRHPVVRWLYELTQARVHRSVGSRFLRHWRRGVFRRDAISSRAPGPG